MKLGTLRFSSESEGKRGALIILSAHLDERTACRRQTRVWQFCGGRGRLTSLAGGLVLALSFRLSVLSAITSTQQRLKLYTKVPPNGLVLYCGTVLTEDGKERQVRSACACAALSLSVLCGCRWKEEEWRARRQLAAGDGERGKLGGKAGRETCMGARGAREAREVRAGTGWGERGAEVGVCPWMFLDARLHRVLFRKATPGQK